MFEETSAKFQNGEISAAPALSTRFCINEVPESATQAQQQ